MRLRDFILGLIAMIVWRGRLARAARRATVSAHHARIRTM